MRKDVAEKSLMGLFPEFAVSVCHLPPCACSMHTATISARRRGCMAAQHTYRCSLKGVMKILLHGSLSSDERTPMHEELPAATCFPPAAAPLLLRPESRLLLITERAYLPRAQLSPPKGFRQHLAMVVGERGAWAAIARAEARRATTWHRP